MGKVKKRPGGIESLKPSAGDGRVSMRLHPHVKWGLEVLAVDDNRTLSSYVEKILIDHLKDSLDNEVYSSGQIVGTPEPRPSVRRR
jgi:hypothetical protein